MLHALDQESGRHLLNEQSLAYAAVARDNLAMTDQPRVPIITALPQTPARGRRRWWLLGLALVAGVLVVGSPALDAPWILGDEHIFIVNNPDVTGSQPTTPTGFRWLDIFLHTHEDLYQPVTIFTYAVEQALWGERRLTVTRLTDVLIHAVNALLLWAVLQALLRRLCADGNATVTVAWALALVWALHPMLVGTYAADMGRTHLLAATFTFLSLLFHLRSLEPRGWPWFVAAYVALLLAMLNKPMVGWIIVAFVLEWVLIGLRRTLCSARVYLIGILCAGFALLTLWTTKETFLLDESPLPIFGDPVARAALGLWIYLRNFVAPLGWLSVWYPPDINTGWSHPAVWAGTIATLVAGVGALLATRQRRWRGVAAGLVWYWAMWLPISGLVGARVLAAQDRYMYQPVVGLLLALGIGLTHWVSRRPDGTRFRTGTVLVVAVMLGVVAMPWDRRLCRDARSTLRRAERTVQHHPNDPRVREFLAATYDFCRDHVTLKSPKPDPKRFGDLMAKALRRAAELAEQHPQYFAHDRSRAEFHRRLSFNFWKIDRYEDSLTQARRAQDFEPEAPMTWVRLAHAYRGLGRWEEALRAHQKLEEIMPKDAPDRGLRTVEMADLLLNRFDDPSKALYKYREALAIPDLKHQAQRVAILGAARCEVLAGKGSDGYELALTVFRAEPDNLEAARVIALYHLRSHHWEQADRAYRGILKQYPTDYESLRGFQNVCTNSGNWRDAAFAWQDARELDPDNPIFRSYFVWAAACAAEEPAGKWADDLLDGSPDNRFGCLARMLLAIRAGDFEQAREWVRRARQGPSLPLAREFVRAEATLELMIERDELPPDAVIIQATLSAETGDMGRGRRLIRSYLDATPHSPWRDLAAKVLTQELHAETAP